MNLFEKQRIYEIFQDPGYLRFVDMGDDVIPSVVPNEDDYEVGFESREYKGETHFAVVVDFLNEEYWDAIGELSGPSRFFLTGADVWSVSVGIETEDDVVLIADLDQSDAREATGVLLDGTPLLFIRRHGDEGVRNQLLPREGGQRRVDELFMKTIGDTVDTKTCIDRIPDDWSPENFTVL